MESPSADRISMAGNATLNHRQATAASIVMFGEIRKLEKVLADGIPARNTFYSPNGDNPSLHRDTRYMIREFIRDLRLYRQTYDALTLRHL